MRLPVMRNQVPLLLAVIATIVLAIALVHPLRSLVVAVRPAAAETAGDHAAAPPQHARDDASPPRAPHGTEPDFVALTERVRPAVVNITSKRTVTVPDLGPFEHFFGPLLRRHRRGPDQTRRTEEALGSGFIIDPSGFVVTNNHVVAGADFVKVKLFDQREFDADVIGRDEQTDLALLRLHGATELPAAHLGHSGDVKVGEFVLAIGNPYGLGNTVTHGIVSATGRVIGAGPYDDFVQTDASINPGNSGGPLFDIAGDVIGVNAIIEAHGRGIGFAIPVDEVRTVIPQLRATGHVERGRLGIAFQPVTSEIASAIGLAQPKGALVAEVEPGGPAAAAGLEPGDVVLAVDGAPVAQAGDLARMIAAHKPGAKIRLTLYRNRAEREVTATLGRLEDDTAEQQAPVEPGPIGGGPAPHLFAPLGIAVANARGGGAVVERVQPGGPADETLRPGDVILEVNGTKVRGASDLRSRVGKVQSGAVLLRVRRGDQVRYVGIRVAGKSK